VKLTRADLKPLRLPIGAAAVLIALGAACVVGSDHYLAQAENANEAAKKQRAEAQKRVERVAEEEREIRQNLVSYQNMTDHGMTIEENRLDLIDSIAKIKKERRLFEITYNIEPQKPLDYAGIKPAGPLDLVASRMKLQMLLLHEQDLLLFLEDLERSGKTYVSVRSCSVARTEGAGTPALAVTPRLRSECQIDLVALKRAKSS
jgi:hypothetical protein